MWQNPGDDGIEMSRDSDIDGLRHKPRRRDGSAKAGLSLAAVEREILQEIASQAGRYGDRLEALLAEMAALRHSIEQVMSSLAHQRAAVAAASSPLNADITRYNCLRAQAQQVQYYLIIHREAMGFWHHDDVFRCYPIPGALTLLSSAHTPNPAGSP